MYSYSKYNYNGKLFDGRVLLYNLVSSSVAILNENEFNSLCTNNFKCEENENDFIRECVEYGFLIPEDEDETEKVVCLRTANNYDSRRVGFQILPTTFCNARCSYCYERNFKGQCMSEQTSVMAVEFIKHYVINSNVLNITWFGGEPFLAENLIISMSKELITFCNENGIMYNADAITNGSLITETSIGSLYEVCKISRIQITIDGHGKEYANRKKYYEKAVEYEDLLKRIELLTKSGIRVSIRLNIDKNNIDSILNVIEDIAGINADFNNIVLYAAPLYSVNKESFCLSKDELPHVFKQIYHKLIDKDFIQTVDGLPMNYSNSVCAARGINNFVISPSGDIYKCEHLLNDDSERIGDVEKGIIYRSSLSKWNDPLLHEKCYSCKHLPICQGGCYAADIQGFGYWRCSYITFLDEVIIDAANYLLKKEGSY